MSWDVGLTDEETGKALTVALFIEGGTYAMGGRTAADVNITYNYSLLYYHVLGLPNGLRGMNGMEAAEALPILERGIGALGDDENANYWKATEGNAKRPLKLLAEWCRQAIRSERRARVFVQ